MNFIDIHTHHLKDENGISIINHTLGRDSEPLNTENQYYSVGIHPWYLQNPNQLFELLNKYIKNPNFIAVGECGIDKFSQFSMELQKEVFINHIKIAEEIQKPIIVHCVKAFNELIRIKKDSKSTVPWIIHGFNANRNILEECLKHGFYFSVGNKAISNITQNFSVVTRIPLEKLFLETDDAHISIQTIYKQVSDITGVLLDKLKETVFNNFIKVFKPT